jgi:hypothetical protein
MLRQDGGLIKVPNFQPNSFYFNKKFTFYSFSGVSTAACEVVMKNISNMLSRLLYMLTLS